MKPLRVVYYYDEEYNVFVTIELFPYIDITMAKSTINSLDQGTQGPLGLNTFLNLFNHQLLDSKYNFTLTVGDNTIPLED